MNDNKKLDEIKEKIDTIEKKVDEQNKRLSVVERRVFAEPKEIKPEKKEPEKPEYIEEVTRPEKKPKEEKVGKAFDFKKLELNIGKYLFQIIGVAIFVVGMGFLFKYSIEKGWMSPLVRIITGFVTATVLIVGGEISRKRQWTLAFIAGGVALYYISLYAATNIYGLIPFGFSFLISIAITALAFILGFLHDSLLISYFSLLGGFLAPVFAGKVSFYSDAFRYFNPENKLFVTAYLALISISFVLLALVRRWYVIATGALLFMFLYIYTPMMENLSLNKQILSIAIFYLAFVLLPYAYASIVTTKKRLLEPFMVLMGGALSFMFCRFYLLDAISTEKIDKSFFPVKWIFSGATYNQVIKYLLLIFGIFYLIKTVLLFPKERFSRNLLSILSLITILSFFGVILLHFDGFTLGMMIQSYAILILLISFLVKEFYLRIFTFIFLVVGFSIYVSNIGFTKVPVYKSLFYNDLNLATAILVLIFVVSAYMADKYKNQLEGIQKHLPKFLELGAYFTIFTWMFSPLWKFPYFIAAISLYSLAVFLIGAIKSKTYLRVFSYICLSISVLRFAYRKDYILPTYFKYYGEIKDYYNFNLLCITFVVVLILYIVLTKMWKKSLPKTESNVLVKISELLLSIFVFLCAGRNLYLFTEGAWFHMTAMSVYYGISALIFIFIGLAFRKNLIRYFGLYISALTLWTLWFIIMAMRETINRVIVFIIVGVIFMLASFIYQKLSKKIS